MELSPGPLQALTLDQFRALGVLKAAANQIGAWASSRFVVAAYSVPAGAELHLQVIRMSPFCDVQPMSWEELQRVKAECGFADSWAVEVYPPAADVVNQINARHLWLLAERPPFAWQPSRHRGTP